MIILKKNYDDSKRDASIDDFNKLRQQIELTQFKNLGIEKQKQYEYIRSIRKQMQVCLPQGKDFIRVGRDYDGGYTMVNNFKSPKIAYSFGICDDVSWDLDMVNKGYDVYMYDHTIDALPMNHPSFHYFKLGIGDESTNPQLKSLEDLIIKNGHTLHND